MNGFLDEDGCPDEIRSFIDSDQDSIVDIIDECPEEPEIFNNYQDGDGCPDRFYEDRSLYEFPDVDNDGIDDRWDQCLDQAENFNGYLDWDGCPDTFASENIGGNLDPDYDGIPSRSESAKESCGAKSGHPSSS